MSHHSPAQALWPLQSRYWPLLEETSSGTPVRCRALLLTGHVDVPRLVEAVQRVVDHHPVLRARLSDDDGTLRLRAAATPAPVAVWSADRADCARALREAAATPRDPRRDPLATFDVVRIAPDQFVLAMTAHFLVADLGSLYATLGSVLRAYFGRHRPGGVPQQPPALGPVPPARKAWWARRLARWQGQGTLAAALGARPSDRRITATQVEPVSGAAWNRLAARAADAGCSPDLAVVALLASWRAMMAPDTTTAVFAAWTDLRHTHGGDGLIGPLSDQIAFGVELDGHAGMTFPDLLRRTHAGLLDTMVRHVPYDELRHLHRAEHPGALPVWDTRVHFCRIPPRSSLTRDEPSLAELGLSVELFDESRLLPVAPPADGAAWDGVNADLHLTEHGVDDVALTLHYNATALDDRAVRLMLRSISDMITEVGEATEQRLPDLWRSLGVPGHGGRDRQEAPTCAVPPHPAKGHNR
ncbi:condensation domain-containing protein [Streptomyces pilosus]|uniref:condensation domain-containing protein n=1 Tax=Streptomyces pilosus TaxID=28893 RepID=UPI0036F871EB